MGRQPPPSYRYRSGVTDSLKVLVPATEDEMIGVFLSAELRSARFGDDLRAALETHRVPKELIENPDTGDQEANRLRRAVLTSYRGWGKQESLFGGLPAEKVQWQWVQLDEEDLHTRSFTISWYFEETFGTRRLSEIAEISRRSPADPNNRILEEIRAGRMPEPPILLAEPGMKRLVILEGHVRLITYLVEPQVVPFPIKALLGVSSRISEWSEW